MNKWMKKSGVAISLASVMLVVQLFGMGTADNNSDTMKKNGYNETLAKLRSSRNELLVDEDNNTFGRISNDKGDWAISTDLLKDNETAVTSVDNAVLSKNKSSVNRINDDSDMSQPETSDILPDGVDYAAIKNEIKSDSYRNNVTINDSSLIVVREEEDGTVPIEKTSWYKEAGITESSIIVSDIDEETGKTTTSYLMKTDNDVWGTVDDINASGEVLIAEPDYVYSSCDEGDVSFESNTDIGKEWYIDELETMDVWSDSVTYGKADGEDVIVAVIDTGVDYTHEDLKENMWVNTAELSGNEGEDDDGNGYVDDIYGVSFIEQTSNPMDDNGHGTHVAGIIAMENNDTGGVGIAYNSQIMAIKAGGADGKFNSSDIAKAVTYAYRNGADVINMSFGSYARSAIIESALQSAFGTSVLVAAAGNDGMPTADAPFVPSGNMYPAGYSYVIGVMAYDENQTKAGFSNWDYENNYGAEYEIIAPGVSIYSTLPGNRYATWSGTSMAAPMVSAAAALLRSSYADKSLYPSRYIMGQIISATTKKISFTDVYKKIHIYSKLDIKDSITGNPKPNLNIAEVYIFDSPEISPVNNGDGIVQPGETIDLGIGIRNQWGAATDVFLTVSAASEGGIDNPYVTFLTEKEVKIGDVGTFGTQDNGYILDENNTIIGVSNPIRVKISDTAPNDANIKFNINYRAKNKLDESDNTVYVQYKDTEYTVSVQNGTVIKGKITSDMTFSKDKYYIVENSLLIPKGVTVNVEPGTKIQFWSSDQSSVYGSDNIAYIQVEGTMNFTGSEKEPIELFPGKDFEAYRVEIKRSSGGRVNMDYVNIINPCIDITSGNHMNLTQDYDDILYRVYTDSGKGSFSQGKAYIKADTMANSTMYNIKMGSDIIGSFDTVQFDNCSVSYSSIKAVNSSFLINQGKYEDASGMKKYSTSELTDVGNNYISPRLDAVSDIYTVNGEKYVVYETDNLFFKDVYGNYKNSIENIRLFNKVMELNGGIVPVFDMNDEAYEAMLSNIYNDIVAMSDNKGSIHINMGAYYDADSKIMVGVEGNVDDISYISSGRIEHPLATYFLYNYPDLKINYSITNNCRYILAKYPDTTEDSKIRNISVDISKLGIIGEPTDFTNNAILNRLASKDTDNWMKVRTSSNNNITRNIRGNYWGTVDEKLINKQVIDFDTNIRIADYLTDGYLTEPAESIYPCVSDIYVTDKNGDRVNTVGNGEYDIHVIFNRDMNTDILPEVSYGPDDPYTDYVVDGGYVNSREWVGRTDIKVLINQGQQYFRVKGAAAASDGWLKVGTDWGRFTFEIEATGAEALTLQSEGKEDEIYLNWTQDEYDTLAGYNIYRSSSGEAGTFKKINTSIIDKKEYSDSKVAAGKNYYYYFTVVDTDMAESKPSNIVLCASVDNIPPVIKHKPEEAFTFGINITVNASVTDNIGVNSVKLFYRMEGSENYKEIEMNCVGDARYNAQIPAKDVSLGTVEYYIVAADGVSSISSGSEHKPHKSEVRAVSRILNVVANEGEAGRDLPVTLNGINFTKDLEVYVDGERIDAVTESDKVIRFTYTPEYMGKKKIELRQNGVVVSQVVNAITVKDSSIRIYNADALLVKGKSDVQYIDYYSNFTGKLDSFECTYKVNGGSCLPNMPYPYLSEQYDYIDDNTVKKYKLNTDCSEGILFRSGFYSIYDDFEYEIVSVKINGVEVENIDVDMSGINLVDSDSVIDVEDLEREGNQYVQIGVGDSFKPKWKVTPVNATMSDYPRYSYDSRYMKLNDDGTFTAVKSGNLKLYIYVGDKEVYYNISIEPMPISSVTVSKSEIKGIVGSTFEIGAVAEPLESDALLSWNVESGSDKISIDSYDNGRKAKVKLLGQGKAVLTVGYNNVTSKVSVEILENKMYTEIEDDIVALNPNQTAGVTAVIGNIQEGAETDVSWKSSNSSVVKVSQDGRLTAVGKGYAIVTASLEDGAGADTVIVLVGSDSQSYILGDVNMDGSVTAADAMLALKLSMLSECPDAVLKMADVNFDGAVTSADAMLILQYVTGKIKSFS